MTHCGLIAVQNRFDPRATMDRLEQAIGFRGINFGRQDHLTTNRLSFIERKTAMRTLAATTEPYIVLPLKARLVAGLTMAAIGVTLIAGVGFVSMPAIHDAAHDVRHVLSFPCH